MFRHPMKDTVPVKKRFNKVRITDIPDEFNEKLQEILFNSITDEIQEQSQTDEIPESQSIYIIDNRELVFSGIQQRGKPLPIIPGFGQSCTTGTKIEIPPIYLKVIIGAHWKNGINNNRLINSL